MVPLRFCQKKNVSFAFKFQSRNGHNINNSDLRLICEAFDIPLNRLHPTIQSADWCKTPSPLNQSRGWYWQNTQPSQPITWLILTKHAALSTNHVADTDKTPSPLNQSRGWYWQNLNYNQPLHRNLNNQTRKLQIYWARFFFEVWLSLTSPGGF